MWRRLLSFRELGILAVLVVEVVLFAALLHRPGRPNPMLDPDLLLALARDTAVLALAAIGACVIIISGGIDLAVGSEIALTCVVTAGVIHAGGGVPAAVLAGLAAGAIMGTLSGLAITQAALPPFIATLGMMSIARGAAFLITRGSTIPIPDSFFTEQFGTGVIPLLGLRLPIPVLLLIVLAGVFAGVLSQTRWGRQVYALGGNEEAARLSGVPVNRLKVTVYALGGLMAGVAGVVFTSYYGTGQSTAALGWELDAIAAVVVGGGSLSGGRGSIIGACLGALIFGVLRSGLAMKNLSDYNQLILGAVVIGVVIFDQITVRRGGLVKRLSTGKGEHST